MVTKIVVLLDGSPLAEQALPAAFALMKRSDVQLVLIRVVEQDVLVGNPTNSIDPILVAATSEYMEELRDKLTDPAQPDYIPVEQLNTRTITGARTHAILDAIATEKPDLVIMTTHARAGVSRLLLGSVASNITRTAHVPVLLLHPAANSTTPTNFAGPILVTLDGSPAAEAILTPAIALAQRLHTSLALLQVVVPISEVLNYGEFAPFVNVKAAAETEEARQNAINYLAQVQARVAAGNNIRCISSVRVDAEVVTTINAYAHEIGAGMLAMATHARGRVGEVVLGSVADAVVRSSHLPVLVTHTQSPTPEKAGAQASSVA